MSGFKTGIILFFAVFLITGQALSQDAIIYLSGRVMEGEVIEVDSLDVRVEVGKKKKKKLIYVSKASIFAIKYGNGKTDFFYEPINDEEYSIREMEHFVKGEQDALKSNRAPVVFIGGIVLGGASMVFLGPFYGLIPLVPYALIAGSINSKIKEGAVSNIDLMREDTYITGYVTKTKGMKIQQAIKGAIAGYISGLAAIAIASQNQ